MQPPWDFLALLLLEHHSKHVFTLSAQVKKRCPSVHVAHFMHGTGEFDTDWERTTAGITGAIQ